MNPHIKLYIPTLFLIFITATAGAQAPRDSTFYIKAALSVTNNGFSIIPAFTLGKPAGFLDMAMGNKRMSFEPQFRYALEGRPWSLVFIYRYKVIAKDKFQLTVGGHLPGLNFVTQSVLINGTDQNASIVRRFLAAELIPNYTINDHISVSIYYLRGHGFQTYGPQNSNFFSVRGSFTNMKLAGKVYFDFTPQVFYLTVDDDAGYYVNATATIGIKNFPLTISGIVNQAIQSNIPAKDFDWNVSLIYTLDKKFVLK